MDVLADRPEPRLAAAAAHAHDGQLAVEGDELLGELSLGERLDLLGPTLPLAVVAEATGLHECRHAGRLEIAEARRGDSQRAEQLLLAQTVLPLLERCDPGHRADARRRLDRHVLELVGDDVRSVRQARERIRIAVLADDELAHARVRKRRLRDRGTGRTGRAAARRARASARAARRRCTRRASSDFVVNHHKVALTPRDRGCRAPPASGRRGRAAAVRPPPDRRPRGWKPRGARR